MDACDDFINRLDKELPELASTGDLIRAGIFKSHQAAYLARHSGTGPEFFRMYQKALYPKKGVLEFMRRGKLRAQEKC